MKFGQYTIGTRYEKEQLNEAEDAASLAAGEAALDIAEAEKLEKDARKLLKKIGLPLAALIRVETGSWPQVNTVITAKAKNFFLSIRSIKILARNKDLDGFLIDGRTVVFRFIRE